MFIFLHPLATSLHLPAGFALQSLLIVPFSQLAGTERGVLGTRLCLVPTQDPIQQGRPS